MGNGATIGFTGTQIGTTEAQRLTLRQWLTLFRRRGAEWMENGDCVGSDEQAGRLWAELGGKVRLRPPTIADKRAYLAADETMPAKPYLERNRDIAKASVLVATPGEPWEQLRSGTWATIRYARALGRPVLKVYPDGTYDKENWP